MRVWDIPVSCLCDAHLLGEHRELHAIWSIITNSKKGYARHPETERWRGSLAGLVARHRAQVAEMKLRDFKHHSPLVGSASGIKKPQRLIDSLAGQRLILRRKKCSCRV